MQCNVLGLQDFCFSHYKILCFVTQPRSFLLVTLFSNEFKQHILPAKKSHPVSKPAGLVSGALNCVKQSQTSLKFKNSMTDILVTLQRVLTVTVLFLKHEN